jgi:hypothetical protein
MGNAEFPVGRHMQRLCWSAGNILWKISETRRKIIRQWMSLPKDKRQTAEQAAAFAKKAVEENELQRSRRDPVGVAKHR